MGEVLPFDSEIITYSRNEDIFNVLEKRTVRAFTFNLSEHLKFMKKYHLDYLISLINKNNLSYVEKCLLNSLQWYYESVKIEVDFDKSTTEATLDSKDYYEYYSYFKLGMKLINLVSSLESLLVFNDKTKLSTRKKRFNMIMNYNNGQHYDYSNDLDELYYLRNDIVHSNKLESLLKFNLQNNTILLRMFIFKFVEVKLDFDTDSNKSLKTKEDLDKFYNGKNRLDYWIVYSCIILLAVI